MADAAHTAWYTLYHIWFLLESFLHALTGGCDGPAGQALAQAFAQATAAGRGAAVAEALAQAEATTAQKVRHAFW